MALFFPKHDYEGKRQFFPTKAPCTEENDPMGSSMRKTTKKGSKAVPSGSKPQVSTIPFRSGVQNPFCHFFMDEPI